MPDKQILKRYFFFEKEAAEYGDIQECVGFERYVNGTIQEQHGMITDFYIDRKFILKVIKEDVVEVDTTEGEAVYVEKVPEVGLTPSPTPHPEIISEKKRKRKSTKGDQISKHEGAEEGLNNEKLGVEKSDKKGD